MNILYICADRGIPILGHKGAAVHVRMLVTAFARAGHTVTIVAPRLGDGSTLPFADRITLTQVPLPPKHELPEAEAREQQALDYQMVLKTFVGNLLAQTQFDMIYERYSLWSSIGSELRSETTIPFVLEVNAPLREEAQRFRALCDGEQAAAIEQRQFATADAIAVVSEALRDYVIEHGAAAAKIHVVPNGIDPQLFHPAVRGGHIRNQYMLHDKHVIGFVGRARPWHDIDTLFDAFQLCYAQDENCHLLLVGQMSEALQARVAQSTLAHAVTLTGPVAHSDVPEYIAAMDVAVSPHAASSDFYFSPLKLYEYLACGVPTIAADIGQPAELIENGATGYLYAPGDSRQLAQHIQMLLNNPAHAREVAWTGAKHVLQTYTWAKNADRVVSWFAPAPQEAPNFVEQLPVKREQSNPGHERPILDDKLRQRLFRATHPELARSFLAELPTLRKLKKLKHHSMSDIAVLKYKRNRRCVLGYTLTRNKQRGDLPESIRLIGKVFRDERGQTLHAIQNALWSTEFSDDSPDKITVPAGLGYLPKMRMQVQAWVSGETLNVLAENISITPLMPLAARAIAKLHQWEVPSDTVGLLRTYGLADECSQLAGYSAEASTFKPAATSTIDNLHASLLTLADALEPFTQPVPVHRDFYYSQLLVDGDHAKLIDFDLLAWSDPAIDIANFAAHLNLLGADLHGNWHHFQPDIALFLKTYTQLGLTNEMFWQRFRVYYATTCFRMLAIVSSRPQLTHLFDQLILQTKTAVLEASSEKLDTALFEHSYV